MTKFQLLVFVICFVGLLGSCSNPTGSSEVNGTNTTVSTLAAPKDFWVMPADGRFTSYTYEFRFNAVEFADSYLVYYGTSNSVSAAVPLVAGQFPPITWTYQSNQKSYGSTIHYFWVRAYDGKNYGAWSDAITTMLY